MSEVDDLLAILKERALTVYLGTDGKPHLKGPKEMMTTKLITALSHLRQPIVLRLQEQAKARQKPRLIEWRMQSPIILTKILAPPLDGANAHDPVYKVCIPFGAIGWRVPPATRWSEMNELPPEWGLKPPSPCVLADTEQGMTEDPEEDVA